VALKTSRRHVRRIAWSLGIVINLLIIPAYFDIASRDFGLSLGALTLGCLSQEVRS